MLLIFECSLVLMTIIVMYDIGEQRKILPETERKCFNFWNKFKEVAHGVLRMPYPIHKWSLTNRTWFSPRKVFELNWWYSLSENQGSGACKCWKSTKRLSLTSQRWQNIHAKDYNERQELSLQPQHWGKSSIFTMG